MQSDSHDAKAGSLQNDGTAKSFARAKPVWAEEEADGQPGRLLAFLCRIERKAGTDAELRIACKDFYRAWLDDVIIAQGPARTAPGYARIDSISLPPHIESKTSLLVVEVSHDEGPRYDRAKGVPFFAAEVEMAGEVHYASGADDGWCYVEPGWRHERMEKFSMQRGRIEAWRFERAECLGRWSWFLDNSSPKRPQVLPPERFPHFLPRGSPMTDFPHIQAKPMAAGTFRTAEAAVRSLQFWWTKPDMSSCLSRIPASQQSVDVPGLLERLEILTHEAAPADDALGPDGIIAAGSWVLFGYGRNATGFPEIIVDCEEPARLLMTFDELLTEGQVDPARNKGYAAFYWDLSAGRHRLRPFDPYCLQWLQCHVLAGRVRFLRITFTEFAHPAAEPAGSIEPLLQPVISAAWQTFRQNTTDLFMDCPGRERAGWLCDSFFTARAESFFSGSNRVEADFLENFFLSETYECVPPGLLPMCWPADNPMGQFIPQWALWFVLEVCDAAQRMGNDQIPQAADSKVREVLGWFENFSTDDGLVANLPGWNFVEWSKANDLTAGINYPTQFLLAACLAAAGQTYREAKWTQWAQALRSKAAEDSFDGTWFCDHALEVDAAWQPQPERTETCQYYAFFFAAATPETHPELWRLLLQSFGPSRNTATVFPEIHPSNAFIGNLLRFHCLKRHGEGEQMRDEVLRYYTPMAGETGTLWEHTSPEASCNHGFASAIAPLLIGELTPIPGTE